MSVLPLLPWLTELGEGLIVPEPSGESTVTEGEEASGCRLPLPVIMLLAGQLCAPAVVGAVAPGPPLRFTPYTICTELPAALFRPETVMVRSATARVP